MLFTSVNKLAIHIIVILLIYLLLRLIPKTPLSNRDILISTVALYAIFLIINTSKEYMNDLNRVSNEALRFYRNPPSTNEKKIQLIITEILQLFYKNCLVFKRTDIKPNFLNEMNDFLAVKLTELGVVILQEYLFCPSTI